MTQEIMNNQVLNQQSSFETIYDYENIFKFGFHITENKLTRYLRDRRLEKSLKILKQHCVGDITGYSLLISCGGVGGEGIFFKKRGFENVTVTDISLNSLKICATLAPEIKTFVLNGESMDLDENSYDVVVVQDGLHHLPRPVSGLTEMLRVARRAAIIIEPYKSLIGSLIGTKWEIQKGSINYVFRWDKNLVNQVTKSFLLQNYKAIKVLRIWDHNVFVGRIGKIFPGRIQLPIAKLIYSFLSAFNFCGNMMVAVIIK